MAYTRMNPMVPNTQAMANNMPPASVGTINPEVLRAILQITQMQQPPQMFAASQPPLATLQGTAGGATLSDEEIQRKAQEINMNTPTIPESYRNNPNFETNYDQRTGKPIFRVKGTTKWEFIPAGAK